MTTDPICGMNVDEAGAVKLSKDGQIYYFCSEHCLKKFTRQHNVGGQEITACPVPAKARWYNNKTLMVAAALVLSLLLSDVVPILQPFKTAFLMYFQRIWWAILLGLALGGLIDHFIPREYVSHILAKPKKATILYSVILGFFMSACSHGILALAVQLHKKGASNPAVVAFLLASPWANLPLTIMLVGFFGLKAFYIIICAIIIAVITGFTFQFLESRDLIERNANIKQTEKDFSILKDALARFGSYKLTFANLAQDIRGIFSGSISLANMVLWWILIGMGLAALAAAYIPKNVFQNYMGPSVPGLGVTLMVATILEVCSEGTAPLAFEIYRQTHALGNSFVFLMAGVVTDYTEIGLIWHNVGRRVAIWLPIITVPQVILLGIIANIIF